MLELNNDIEYNRYTILFENDIKPETIQPLIDTLVGVPSADLFFSTMGGEIVSMNILIHFINNHPDINVYLTSYIASAGTLLLTDCTKPVYLTEDLDWILFHMIDRDFGGKFRKQHFNTDKLYGQTKKNNELLCDKYKKLGLTSKEIKEYLKGEDVILYRDDFKRLKVSQK